MKTLSILTVAAWTALGAATSIAASKKPELPKPPPQVADLAGRLTGSWKCDGHAWMPDGSSHDMAGTWRAASHMNGFWIHESWDGTMDQLPFQMDVYATYDGKQGKWRRVGVDSLGGQMVGSAAGA